MKTQYLPSRGLILAAIFALLLPVPALAHYGMIVPSDQMVAVDESKHIDLKLSFWHPFEGIPMHLDKPVSFQVYRAGQAQDLLPTLTSTKTQGHQTWATQYNVKRPGLYTFVMEPQPYWEPAEDAFIIHYTKVVVTAFGDDEGWDGELGLKTEIVPLAKPFGQYAGNLFQGIVKLNGKAVPYAEVEIEYYNEAGTYTAPSDYMVTQTIKADANGIFSYAMPKAGWWGFAALNTADYQLSHDNKPKDVELGAVIWVKSHEMK